MFAYRYLYRANTILRCTLCLISALTTTIYLPPASLAETVEGFLQPNETIELSPPYRGILSNVSVREGDIVKAGEILAELDSSVLKASLEIARAKKNSTGELSSAKAVMELRRKRLHALKAVQSRGGIRNSELERAEADVKIAKAQILEVQERLHIASLEYMRLKAQLEERRLRSPINGTVLEVHAEQAELVEANRSIPVFTIAQLNPLLAVFHLTPHSADILRKSGEVTLEIAKSSSQTVPGQIRYVSPTIEAQSGTVCVKVELPNSDSRFISGTRCTLTIP